MGILIGWFPTFQQSDFLFVFLIIRVDFHKLDLVVYFVVIFFSFDLILGWDQPHECYFVASEGSWYECLVLLWKLLFQTSLCERSVCFVVIFFSFDLCPRLGLVLGDINVYFVAIPTFSSKHSLWEVCFFVVILFAFPSAFIPSLRRLHECLFCCYAKFYFKPPFVRGLFFFVILCQCFCISGLKPE